MQEWLQLSRTLLKAPVLLWMLQKVLKDAPERAGELPPKSKLVQQARGLVQLSDRAFGAVINNVVPANYGAIVGRLIREDEGMQDAAIAVLAKTQPANEFRQKALCAR